MARWEFKLPDIGEGVTEGEIVGWLVEEGQAVREDAPMVEVMTDKATVTITSPKTGTIAERRGAVGEVVKVHSVLVVFELEGASPASPAHGERAPVESPAKKDDGPAATAVGDIREDLPGMRLVQSGPPRPSVPPARSSYFAEKPLATPATRKLARDLGVDLRRVAPTGDAGRVTSGDVRAAAGRGAPRAAEGAPSSFVEPRVASGAERAPQRIAPPSPSTVASDAGSLEERTPLKGVRKRIFENMARSKHTAAHFTFVEECDVTALKELRARLRPAAEREGVKLSFLPFIVKAVVAALKRHPSLNAAFDEATNEIVTRRFYNLGIASATEAGLVVPVVKNADRLSVLGIAREIERLANDAKQGKIRLDDLQGSTFTITSLGALGGLFATPIVNFPEVAILGVHQMKQKPVVRDGQIAIGDVMLLSLSFDHRLIDGHVGAAFAYEVIGYLEQPDKLFLELV